MVNKNIETDQPQVGDMKTIIRFAWVPTKMGNHKTIWLKQYQTVLRYSGTFDKWQELRSQRIKHNPYFD
jgi:hypothetical protein